MTPRPASAPVGTVTRGTTNPNRLRRMDRWIAAVHGAELRRAADPLAVDLGYGAAPWTALELLHRLRTAAPRTRVAGVEIDPARVASARPYEREGLVFLRGGFEIPVPGSPVLVRAANVLRQYDEGEVAGVWRRLCARLAPADPAAGSRGGLLVEGTCDEIGRLSTYGSRSAPRDRAPSPSRPGWAPGPPSDLAERLPKALIHRNVPGEPVHAFLRDFDRAWAAAAPYASYGARQRWIRAVRDLTADWPVTDGPARWRQGEVTVRWGPWRRAGGDVGRAGGDITGGSASVSPDGERSPPAVRHTGGTNGRTGNSGTEGALSTAPVVSGPRMAASLRQRKVTDD